MQYVCRCNILQIYDEKGSIADRGMGMITRISAYIMPLVILIIVGYGLYKKSDNYDNFIKGAADGMKTVVDIAPRLLDLWLRSEC